MALRAMGLQELCTSRINIHDTITVLTCFNKLSFSCPPQRELLSHTKPVIKAALDERLVAWWRSGQSAEVGEIEMASLGACVRGRQWGQPASG